MARVLVRELVRDGAIAGFDTMQNAFPHPDAWRLISIESSGFRLGFGDGPKHEVKGAGFDFACDGRPTGGTITSWRIWQGDDIRFEATGLRLSARDWFRHYLAGDWGGLLTLVLSQADTIVGSRVGDRLLGFAGDDFIRGGDGNDRLHGMAGDDVLDGGAGRDRMSGGLGNDTYIISERADTIVEPFSIDRADLVRSQVSVNLSRLSDGNIENATLTGTGNTNAIGNETANSLRGNEADNTLLGLLGDDVLVGRDGDDMLLGGPGQDRLYGGPGNDVLAGGLGADILSGGLGADRFAFSGIVESSNGAAMDRILDFGLQDVIDLTRIDADRTIVGNQDFGFVGAAGFTGAPGELRFVAGILSGDTDGDAVADFSIRVSGVATLTIEDIAL